MKRAALHILVSVFLLSAAQPLLAQDTVIDGVRVIFSAKKQMFPLRWRSKNTAAEAVVLTASQQPRACRILRSAMAKYPPGLPDRYLNRIYVSKSLHFYGYPYGGTYAHKTLYLTLDEENTVHQDPFLEERFHHELSSILWKENLRNLDLEKWQSFNPQGFVYGEGGLDAIRSGIASMEIDPGYFDIGFINRYAMTEIEQDINVMAQNLFMGGPRFWEIVDSKPAIRGKVFLLIGFYHSLDPGFTEEFFRSLR